MNNRGIRKVVRYAAIYGIFRTLTKVIGRLRPRFKLWLILKFPLYKNKGKKVGLVGCGHHAFSSIAYFLSTSTSCNILFALDVDKQASSSLAFAYNSKDVGDEFLVSSQVELPDLVYISSNHASHTEYAVKFLEYGCDVFIEKPISIDNEQLDLLSNAVRNCSQKVYVGYNRPHSPAISIIKKYVNSSEEPFTLSCFISGHFISEDHWYRDPAEGTRIVSNLGHWIDLSVHIMFWRKRVPEYLEILISYSNSKMPSDNIAVSIASSNHDLITFTFTSRCEPFEGVNETINFQQGDLIAKIDDFRTTKIWKSEFYKKHNHWPKNNGHKEAVLQPFGSVEKRVWNEVESSTRLMLHIEGMVLSNVIKSRFEF